MARKGTDIPVNIDDISINTEDSYINELANTYIQDRRINVLQPTGFNSLLLHIANNITVNRDSIDDIYYYFTIYTQLSSICNILPSMLGLSLFINIPIDTINSWLNGSRRKSNPLYVNTFKKISEYFKKVTLDEAATGNVGAIYLSKAVYHMSDAPQPVKLTQNNLYVNAPVTREGIAAEFGLELSDNNNKLIENKGQ